MGVPTRNPSLYPSEPSNLRKPSRALGGSMTGLLLSSPAPPAAIVVRLAYLVFEIGADDRVARGQLVISTRSRFGRSSWSEALPLGRLVLPPGAVRSAIHRAVVQDRW